jgi:hypothetical protein
MNLSAYTVHTVSNRLHRLDFSSSDVRFEVSMMVKIYIVIVWVATLCSNVGYEGISALYHKIKAAGSFETMVTTYRTVWYQNPKDLICSTFCLSSYILPDHVSVGLPVSPLPTDIIPGKFSYVNTIVFYIFALPFYLNIYNFC